MIQVNGLSKSYGARELIKNVSFVINPRERVALVGRNGHGKSTLFKLILGKESPDEGNISIPKNYTLGTLDQHINFTKETVLEECTQVLSEEEKFDSYKAESILMGLGFSTEDFKKSPSSFSGGYQVRINLCKSLLLNPSMLLLDEPTNYLDIVSLKWLTSFLKKFPGEVVVISHDQDFLNGVCTHTMGIHRKELRKVKGTTFHYYQQLEEAEEIYEQTRLNQERKAKEIQNFVDRFRAKATKASQAQSRLKELEKMEILEKLDDVSSMSLRFQYHPCPAKIIMNAENLSFGYKDGELLFKDLSFHVGKIDRIGVIGKNGKGKSTLLNVLANELTESSGKVSSHSEMLLGHFGQTNINRLTLENTIYNEIANENDSLSISDVRGICGAMMFSGDDADKKIKVLSGGERSRVMLGKILAKKTNLLFLDEPTNHLDIESIDVLSDELQKFKGAVVVVTHSEMLLRKVCNKLIIFHQGKAEYFPYGYDHFLEKIGWEEEEIKPRKVKKTTPVKGHNFNKENNEKKIQELTKKINEIEESIETLEKYQDVVSEKLSKASMEGDVKKIEDLSKTLSDIENKVEALFETLEDLVIQQDEL